MRTLPFMKSILKCVLRTLVGGQGLWDDAMDYTRLHIPSRPGKSLQVQPPLSMSHMSCNERLCTHCPHPSLTAPCQRLRLPRPCKAAPADHHEVREAIGVHGGAVSSVPVRDSPPPPLRALPVHLVTKGQWLLAIHMVAPNAPEIFFSFPLPT